MIKKIIIFLVIFSLAVGIVSATNDINDTVSSADEDVVAGVDDEPLSASVDENYSLSNAEDEPLSTNAENNSSPYTSNKLAVNMENNAPVLLTNKNTLSSTGVDTSNTVQKTTSWTKVTILKFKIKTKWFKNKYKKKLNKISKKMKKKMKKNLIKILKKYAKKGWHYNNVFYKYRIGSYKTSYKFYVSLYRIQVYNWVTGESYYE